MSAPGVIADTMANLRTITDKSGKQYTYKSQRIDESTASGSLKAKYLRAQARNNQVNYVSTDAKLNEKPFDTYLKYVSDKLTSIGNKLNKSETFDKDYEILKIYDNNIRLQDREDIYYEAPDDTFDDLYKIFKALDILNLFNFDFFWVYSYKEAVAIYGKGHIDGEIDYYNDEEERVNKKTLVVLSNQVRIQISSDDGGKKYLDAAKKINYILPK
jgi:hypothetical protein